MHRRLLVLILSAACVSCASPPAAGPYPNGFITGHRMHFWAPWFGNAVFGTNVPVIKDPPSSDYVVVDWWGNVIVSPELSKKLQRP